MFGYLSCSGRAAGPDLVAHHDYLSHTGIRACLSEFGGQGETRRRKRGLWSDDFITLIVMRELFELRRLEKPAATVHHLSTLPGMPTQRDQRIRRLVENLCEQGLVSRVPVGELVGYELNGTGETWWNLHQSVLGLFRSLRESDTSP